MKHYERTPFDARVIAAACTELRNLRVRAGLTQAHVSARATTHKPIVARIERGTHSPSLETCARIAVACGGSLHDVLAAVDRAIDLTGAGAA